MRSSQLGVQVGLVESLGEVVVELEACGLSGVDQVLHITIALGLRLSAQIL